MNPYDFEPKRSTDTKWTWEILEELTKKLTETKRACEMCGKETNYFDLTSHYGSDTLLCPSCMEYD